jgi:DNA mismatch endonuclease (patch repair protein)
MADVFSKRKRSEVMSRIRGRGNKDTELAMARLLRVHKIKGWRRHVQVRIADCGLRRSGAHGVTRPTFRVKPDFVFRQVRLALFVDGCFWHGCPKHATKPVNNRAFWRRKPEGNKKRDALVTRTLRRAGRVKWRGHHAAGWRVVRIWECELTRTNKTRLLKRLNSFLKKNSFDANCAS